MKSNIKSYCEEHKPIAFNSPCININTYIHGLLKVASSADRSGFREWVYVSEEFGGMLVKYHRVLLRRKMYGGWWFQINNQRYYDTEFTFYHKEDAF